MLKYIYDTGKIERDFVLKKVEGSCKQDPNHTKLIGVMCRTCPFYDGEKKFYSRNSEFLRELHPPKGRVLLDSMTSLALKSPLM